MPDFLCFCFIGIVANSHETTDMVDGDTVVHSLAAADGNTVLFSTTLGQLIGAGIVSGSIVSTEYGLVQVYGYHPNVKASAGVTAGAAIRTSGTTKEVAIGVTADDPVIQMGIALTATSTGRLKAFLRCM